MDMKIPKHVTEEDDSKSPGGGGDLDEKKKIERVCEVCNKVFGSGKALGGHMRIHFQAYKDLIFMENRKKNMSAQQSNKFKKIKKFKNSINCNGSVEPRCALCGKIFPSMKALFGHMRCHPGRKWRGIRPPPPPPPPPSPLLDSNNLSFSCSTSSGADLVDEVIEKLEVLPQWKVRAKRRQGRGRKAVSNVVDEVVEEEFLEAVEDLMMFAKGGEDSCDHLSSDLTQKNEKGETFEVTNSNSIGNSNDELMKSSRKCLMMKKSVEEIESESSLVGKDGLIFKNKRKKMKLRDLDQIQDSPPPVMVAPLPAATISHEKYKCSICGKSFPTHQALGGHKSSHNKFRMVIQNSIDDAHQYHSPPSARKMMKMKKGSKQNDEVGGHSIGRVLDFDLNELPPVEENHNDEPLHLPSACHFASSLSTIHQLFK